MLFIFRSRVKYFLFLLLFASCKSQQKNKLVLYTSPFPTHIEIKSSCRLSSIDTTKKINDWKEKLISSTEQSISELHFKRSNSSAKSNYKINKAELIITERCDADRSGQKAAKDIQQILTLEDLTSGKLVSFRSDTIPIENLSLSKPNTVAQQETNIAQYIPSLTRRNFIQVKKHFNN